MIVCYVCNNKMTDFTQNEVYLYCPVCKSKFNRRYKYDSNYIKNKIMEFNFNNIDEEYYYYKKSFNFFYNYIKQNIGDNIAIDIGPQIPIMPTIYSNTVYSIGHILGIEENNNIKNYLDKLEKHGSKNITLVNFNILNNNLKDILLNILNRTNLPAIISFIHTIELLKYKDIIKILEMINRLERDVYILFVCYNSYYNNNYLTLIPFELYKKLVNKIIRDNKIIFNRQVNDDFILFFKIKNKERGGQNGKH